MPHLNTVDKLAILADAAKYDASCASSGAQKRTSLKSGGVGSTEGMGICHSYAPDGRCISLLKVLLTNYCQYDCLYCVNRVSSNVQRARFNVPELVKLTLDFYKRNYIEGLFLSSGIIKSPDYTMEQMVQVARSLREDHRFQGYIHIKTIPDAAPELIEEAGRYADRLSINVELPSRTSLGQLAPEKDAGRIRTAMASVRLKLDEKRADKREGTRRRNPRAIKATSQSTQMIIGADSSSDAKILSTSASLYAGYKLSRVYYSAFSPTPHPSSKLLPQPPPLQREHRLYQADWLLRFYDFELDEIVADKADGMLDLDIDPKLAWALRHRERFPVDVNRASRHELLRVPGLGTRSVAAILRARRLGALRLENVARLTTSLTKVRPFIATRDWHPRRSLEAASLRAQLAPPPAQADLFA
ncbi:MAG: putative DNA modification/repair radical SAM protein [Pseudomonadota bacterium]